MSFTRVRAPGGWTALSDLLDTEIEKFDDQLSNAIDGRHGGAYAPDNEIEIGGSGFRVSTTLTVDGTLQCDGSTILDTLQVLDDASFEDPVVFNDTTTFHAVLQNDNNTILNTLQVLGTTSFEAGIHVNVGTAVFDEDVTIGDDLTVTDDASVGGDLAVGGLASLTALLALGASQFDDKITLTSHARFKFRVAVATNASATYSVNDYDVVRLPGGTALSADRDWTIDATGAEVGMRMALSRHANASAFVINVKDGPSGTTLIALQNSSGTAGAVEICFDGTNWFVLSVGQRV